MKESLLIIGNGFDLSLGHKTKYIDFLEWLEQHVTLDSNKNIWIDFYLNNIENYVEFAWFDFEQNLAHILNKEKDRPEVELFWNNGLIKGRPSLEVKRKVISDWKEFTNYFLKYLSKWDQYKIISRDINFWDSNRIRIFNFNFTNNLNLKVEHNSFFGYTLPKIIQVHGNLQTGILGSDEIINSDFIELTKQFKKFDLSIDFNKFLHDINNHYGVEVNIHILGHSICPTDWDLYKEIIEKDQKDSFIWKIYFYNEDDKISKNLNLFKLNKQYFNGKKTNNKLKYLQFETWEKEIFNYKLIEKYQ